MNETRTVTRDVLAKALQRVQWPAGWNSQRAVNESLNWQAAAIFSALPSEPASTGLDVERLARAMWNMSGFDPASPYIEVKRVEVREFTEQITAEYARLAPQDDPA